MENPMITGYGFEESVHQPKVIAHCTSRSCKEEVCEHEGIEFDGYIYCSSACLGDHLLEEGAAVDLSA